MSRVTEAASGDDNVSDEAAETASGKYRYPFLRALSYPLFRRLLAAQVTFGFANWMNRLAVGFLVLDETGSTFLTALSFAVQTAPGVVVAPIAGTISDRVDRRYLLATASAMKGVVFVLLGLLVIGGVGAIWPVIALVAVGGVFSSFEMPSSQALITDIVEKRDAMNGIALQSVATRAVGVLGALAGGILIETVGGPTVFFVGAAVISAGVLIVLSIAAPPRRPAERSSRSIAGDVVDGLKVMGGLPLVRTLLIMAIVVEILAFSYMSIMPVVAKEVLGVGAIGLGALTTMAGVGSLIGSVGLVALSDYRRKGWLMLGVTLIYGLGILAFSGSSLFVLSLLIVMGIGMMAAAFDALQWTLLQLNVPDRMRGRAVGGWVFAIGFGWIGHLELGALGGLIGVQWALAINGGLVVLVAMAAVVLVPRLRQMES